MSWLKQNRLFLVLLVLFSIPSIIFLFKTGFFQSDDGEWMIIRFSAFFQALRDGQFPVRFLGRLNYGYGYPVANFLYPGYMYLGVPVHLLGFNFVNTIKIILGLSMLGSAIFSFLWLSKIFNKYAALIGALFYLYTPYHLYDLYKRGSVGEILALAIVPFILWMIERRSLFFTSIGISILIVSHNTLALLFLPIIFLYSLLSRAMDAKNIFLSFLFGTLMSSFFILPAIFELKFVQFSDVQISDLTKYFASISLIGVSSFLVLIISLGLLIIRLTKIGKQRSLVIFFLTVSIISIFLSSDLNNFIWRLLPSSFIQFPFRLLSCLLIGISFLSAFTVNQFKKPRNYILSIALIFALIFSAWPYLKPEAFFDKEEGFYSTNEGTTTVQDEYLPKWVGSKPTKHFKDKVEIIEGKGEVSNLFFNSKKITFDYLSNSDSKIRIYAIYYPGWKGYADNQEVKLNYSNNQGIMDVELNNRARKIKLVFQETPLRLWSDFISILFFVILIIISLDKKYYLLIKKLRK